MIDLKTIREEPEKLKTALRRRHAEDLLPDVDRLLELDAAWREAVLSRDTLRHEQNRVSKEIGRLKREKQDVSELLAQMSQVADEIRRREEEMRRLRADLDAQLLLFPNIPHRSVPDGVSSDDNVVLRAWGTLPTFDFEPKPHWDLGASLGVLDLPRGSKLAGSGFPLFKGAGARLQRALIHLMLDVHTQQHGYTEICPPLLVNRQTITGTGHLPKFEEDLYRFPSDDSEDIRRPHPNDLFLIPTAEVPLTSLYADEILNGDDLPILLTAYTPCFRREAGAAGKETRGILRVHQFEKVELVKLTTPESSYDEHEKMLADAEHIVRLLELPYRVVLLCAGDMGFQSSKTYDIEVWAAGQDRWLEVSSVSNCEDFQARRANIRFRRAEGEKPEFVHTLNGSGLALPRVFIALMENNQRADGTIRIPDALQPYFGSDELR